MASNGRRAALELPQNLNRTEKPCPSKHCTVPLRLSFLFVFFKISMKRRHFNELLYLFILLPPFPKHDRLKSLIEWCRLGFLLFYLSTSPQTSPVCSSPLQLPSTPSHTWPLTPHRTVLEQFSGIRNKPACRYTDLRFSIMSLSLMLSTCAIPCMYPETQTLFLSFLLSFSFGLNMMKPEQKTLWRREKAPYCTYCWICWRSSCCRIFYIARIVRQWEDRGAIWREFSYWKGPQQLPLRVSYNRDTYKYI